MRCDAVVGTTAMRAVWCACSLCALRWFVVAVVGLGCGFPVSGLAMVLTNLIFCAIMNVLNALEGIESSLAGWGVGQVGCPIWAIGRDGTGPSAAPTIPQRGARA